VSLKRGTPWETGGVAENERIEWRELLREAFAVSGMSERAVSEQAPVNRGSLSDLLAGKSVPRVATIDALRRVFDLDGDLSKARREVAERKARPTATPSMYWKPEPGSPEADELVTWGHMEERFAEQDARIARLEQAVINLSNMTDRLDPRAQDAALRRLRRQQKAARLSEPSARTSSGDSALAADDTKHKIEEQEADYST